MNASPRTTSMKPAISSCAVDGRTPPIAAAPAPSTTKTTVKPTMNGRLAEGDAPRRPRLAEPVGLDRRDRREVAGHERQHAGRDDRDEPARNATGICARTCSALVEAGELLVHPRARAPGSSVGRGRPRLALRGSSARRGSRATSAPPTSADERQQPGEQVEALLRRRGEDLRPELGDELVLDLALRVACRDPAAR